MLRFKLCTLLLIFISSTFAFAQVNNNENNNSNTKRKSQITPLPALSYSPETGFTFGILGDYYFDLADGNTAVSLSKLRLISVYSTNNNILFEPRWELYFKDDDYRIIGRTLIRRYLDRNYGLGNDSNLELINFAEKKDVWESDTTNYYKFQTKQWFLESAFLKKVADNLYVGPQIETEIVWGLKNDSLQILNQHQPTINEIDESRLTGWRAGLGINVSYDSRDRPNYPKTGTYAQLSTFEFMSATENTVVSETDLSDLLFTSIKLDARQYFNTFQDQVFAIRAVLNNRFGLGTESIMYRGLSRFGGNDWVRGYFQGTYQDLNAATFEAEYRVPLFWRLGATAFANAGQTYGQHSDFSFDAFHLSVGGGLRVNINKSETTNIRIDYGLALDKTSAFGGKAQGGLYFSLGEAF